MLPYQVQMFLILITEEFIRILETLYYALGIEKKTSHIKYHNRASIQTITIIIPFFREGAHPTMFMDYTCFCTQDLCLA